MTPVPPGLQLTLSADCPNFGGHYSDLIFTQGQPATGFFVIKMGRVKVFQISTTGREQILHIFDSGDNFAEVAAMDGQCFPASATALEPATVAFFPELR